jgi:hypothetical protein
MQALSALDVETKDYDMYNAAMNVTLDESLIYRAKRRAREDGLTPEERIALNLFWRKGVRVPILAKVFRCSKNTCYYKSLTGEADSYPNSNRSNSAAETNALIDSLGVDEAWRRFVTDDMVAAVNAEMALEVERRER